MYFWSRPPEDQSRLAADDIATTVYFYKPVIHRYNDKKKILVSKK